MTITKHLREALISLLVKEYNATIIGEASNAEDFWKIDNYWLADIILMDIMMSNENGIELTHKILWHYRHLKIIAVTMHVDKVYLTSLIETGFFGCIFKNELLNSLDSALESVMKGQRFFPDNMMINDNRSINLLYNEQHGDQTV